MALLMQNLEHKECLGRTDCLHCQLLEEGEVEISILFLFYWRLQYSDVHPIEETHMVKPIMLSGNFTASPFLSASIHTHLDKHCFLEDIRG